MAINNSQVGVFGTELLETMTGSAVLIGTLTQSPVILIFDNLSTVAVEIYVNGTSAEHLWKTFPAGEAILLDCRANHGVAPNFTFAVGTTFFGNGASGDFSISIIYAQNM